MKKRIEWPWFVVPFVLLPVVAFGLDLLRFVTMQDGLVSGSQYVRLLLQDTFFWVMLFNTYVRYWLTGLVCGGALGLLLQLIRRKAGLSRRWFYGLLFALSVLVAMGLLAMINRTLLDLSTLPYALMIANTAALFVWLAEKVGRTIRKRKQASEVE